MPQTYKEGVFEFLDICKINHTLRNRKDDQRLSQTALGFRNVNLVSLELKTLNKQKVMFKPKGKMFTL